MLKRVEKQFQNDSSCVWRTVKLYLILSTINRNYVHSVLDEFKFVLWDFVCLCMSENLSQSFQCSYCSLHSINYKWQNLMQIRRNFWPMFGTKGNLEFRNPQESGRYIPWDVSGRLSLVLKSWLFHPLLIPRLVSRITLESSQVYPVGSLYVYVATFSVLSSSQPPLLVYFPFSSRATKCNRRLYWNVILKWKYSHSNKYFYSKHWNIKCLLKEF